MIIERLRDQNERIPIQAASSQVSARSELESDSQAK